MWVHFSGVGPVVTVLPSLPLPRVETLCGLGHPHCATQSSMDELDDMEERECQTQVLILVVHGGNILDPGGGDPMAKAGDVATLASVVEKVTRAHFQTATDRLQIRMVPLNPYSYDESCVSSSVDHLPLAALPLLAISAPSYQDAVATVIARANQAYHSFLQSQDGQGFTGQVCLIGDCVGGVLCFDALCFSNPSKCSQNDSTESLKVGGANVMGDSPGLLNEASPSLRSSKRLSRSNVDISIPETPKHRGSEGGVHEVLFIQTLLHSSGRNKQTFSISPGRFDFDVSDCFLLGCPAGLVLAMRRTVLPAARGEASEPSRASGPF
ncbi:hypothetical protein JZ751_017072, partial [Albula glossodonta]